MKFANGTPAQLRRTQFNGTPVVKVVGTPFGLVKSELDDQKPIFEPVDSLDSDINSKELHADYGLWNDKNHDGEVQRGEVKSFTDFRKGETSYDGSKLYTMEKVSVWVETESNSAEDGLLDSAWSSRPARNSGIDYMSPMLPSPKQR